MEEELGDSTRCQLQRISMGTVEGGRAAQGSNMAPEGQLKEEPGGGGCVTLHYDLVLGLLGQSTVMVT